VSIAGAFRQDGFFAQTFFGNDVSTFVSALTDPGRNSSAEFWVSNPLSSPAGVPLNATGLFVKYAPVGPREVAVFGHNDYVEKFARITISETETAAKLAGKVELAMGGKALWDLGSFAAATFACSR